MSKQAMKIQTGHIVTADVQQVQGKEVTFADEEGHPLFTARIIDGITIEVRAVGPVKYKDTIYSECLSVIPRYANAVQVTRCIYPMGTKK
jgi:hypothetical protein